MTRDELQSMAVGRLTYSRRLIAQWATGCGKSGIVLKFLQAYTSAKTLILVPEQNNIQNWLDEFEKFKIPTHNVTIACYASFKKYYGSSWDLLVFDECFRGDTEVLTSEGFKRFDSLTQKEKIAQYNDDGTIEFVAPLRFIKRYHNGELCKLSLATGRKERCCYMTPNHQQVYRTKSMSNYTTTSIKDLSLNSYNYIPLAGFGNSEDSGKLSTIERLAIAIQADGSFDREQSDCYVYRIQVAKDRKKNRLMSILNNYPSDKWSIEKANNDDFIKIRIKMPKRNAKLLSSYFTPEISSIKANEFIDEIMQWDGTDLLAGNTRYYSSKIKENSDLVSAIAVQAGYKVLCGIEKDNRKDSYNDIYRVYINPKKELTTQSLKKEFVPYNGFVYCVEVPSHKIIVRSEGYVFITGNCPHMDTQKRIAICKSVKGSFILALGAVISEDERYALESVYGRFYKTIISLQHAIKMGILPSPQINVLHLRLDDTKRNHAYNGRLCTMKELYDNIHNKVANAVNAYNASPNMFSKNRMLKAGNERKKLLGKLKQKALAEICHTLEEKGTRFICFCSSIKQTESLCKDKSFTSKTPTSAKLLDKFNNHEINSLYVVGKLIEGQNLKDIECGVIGQLGGTQRITVQEIGRIIRGEKPIIYVPIFDGTKDEGFLSTLTNNIPEEYIKHYNYRVNS